MTLAEDQVFFYSCSSAKLILDITDSLKGQIVHSRAHGHLSLISAVSVHPRINPSRRLALREVHEKFCEHGVGDLFKLPCFNDKRSEATLDPLTKIGSDIRMIAHDQAVDDGI